MIRQRETWGKGHYFRKTLRLEGWKWGRHEGSGRKHFGERDCPIQSLEAGEGRREVSVTGVREKAGTLRSQGAWDALASHQVSLWVQQRAMKGSFLENDTGY